MTWASAEAASGKFVAMQQQLVDTQAELQQQSEVATAAAMAAAGQLEAAQQQLTDTQAELQQQIGAVGALGEELAVAVESIETLKSEKSELRAGLS